MEAAGAANADSTQGAGPCAVSQPAALGASSNAGAHRRLPLGIQRRPAVQFSIGLTSFLDEAHGLTGGSVSSGRPLQFSSSFFSRADVGAVLLLEARPASTGRPCVGLKGTVVSSPHWEQVVRVSERTRGPPRTRLALHCLQCLGSFLNCLSWKNNCSPAVKTNSAPQSLHFNTLSVNSMAGFPNAGKLIEIGHDP